MKLGIRELIVMEIPTSGKNGQKWGTRFSTLTFFQSPNFHFLDFHSLAGLSRRILPFLDLCESGIVGFRERSVGQLRSLDLVLTGSSAMASAQAG